MKVSKLTFDNLVKLISSIDHSCCKRKLFFVVTTEGKLTYFIAGIGIFLSDVSDNVEGDYYYYIMRKENDGSCAIVYIKSCKLGKFLDNSNILMDKCDIKPYSQIRSISPTKCENDLDMTSLDSIKTEETYASESDSNKPLVIGFHVDDFSIDDLEDLNKKELRELYKENKAICEIYDLDTFFSDLNHDLIDTENYFWLKC